MAAPHNSSSDDEPKPPSPSSRNASAYSSCGDDDAYAGSRNPTGGGSASDDGVYNYCSANSVLGSVSLCSSVDAHHSELLLTATPHYYDPYSPRRQSSSIDGDGGSCYGVYSHGDDRNLHVETIGRGYNEDVGSLPNWCTYYGSDQSDFDDNDSLLGSCTDDEAAGKSYLRSSKPMEDENENPLGMCSAVALGSRDWEGLMEEVELEASVSVPFSLFRELQVTRHVEDDLNVDVLDPLFVEKGQEDRQGVAHERSADSQLTDTNVQQRMNSTGDYNQEGNTRLGEEHIQVAKQSSMPAAQEVETHLPLCNVPIGFGAQKKATMEENCKSGQWISYYPLESNTSWINLREEKYDGKKENGKLKALDMNGVCCQNTMTEGIEQKLDGKDLGRENFVLKEVRKPDTSDAYEEMVLEMEEILLDAGKSPHQKSTYVKRGSSSYHFQDSSSMASTSVVDDVILNVKDSPKIRWVEVVGAKQKRGNVSFGERLIGVKEYTVYKIKVCSGDKQWEIERRYRDFFSLYRQLRTFFLDRGTNLPSPWCSVEQEARKFFGNVSPTVISERSILIQDCLRSLLYMEIPSGATTCLTSFLLPGEEVNDSSFLKALVPQYLQRVRSGSPRPLFSGESSQEDASSLGTTVSLILHINPSRSMRQLLEAQHYICAGCHGHLEAQRTLFRELVQSFGWHKPRLCEYTGQLFCSSCHTNDTAVLPAKVLHLWDFSLYPVSQLAKAYLDSIYEQPMLCVSAVNPFLFSKVPALFHVMGVRKKIGAMLSSLQCPFRRSIQRGIGTRRYLLENNEFFALRDLVDLSKGAFAALPTMLETMSSKIFEHITQQCLLCYDGGVPCAARQACNDPSSVIFPFQEADAKRCALCRSIFHEPCFEKLLGCPCRRRGGNSNKATSSHQVVDSRGQELATVGGGMVEPHPDSNFTLRVFSDIFTKALPDRISKGRKNSPVILMGSLPSMSL